MINNKLSQKKIILISFLGFLILIAAAVPLVYTIKYYNCYASGDDIWGHLFKSDLLYQEILKGNYFPLFTEKWYNGIQPYRYWAPLPYYILAVLQFIAKGSVENSYYLFTGFSFIIGGIPWILFGASKKRPYLGIFFSLIWFFLPENTRVFFCEGNLNRMVSAIIIPWLVYFIFLYSKKNITSALIGIIIFMLLMTFTHAMITAMMGVGSFIFVAIDAICNKELIKNIKILFAEFIGIMIGGIWLYPALHGGILSIDENANSSVMAGFMYNLSDTLNSFQRITGNPNRFYISTAIVFISIFALFFSQRKNKSGFYFVLIILFATTPALLPILRKLPLNQVFWMMRFSAIVYAFFIFAFIEWKLLKKYICIICCLLIAIDCMPSLMFRQYTIHPATETVSEMDIVQNNTTQRANIMDSSLMGSYPSFTLCTGDNGKDYTFGWAWQGAVTATNIVLLNTAIEKYNYIYVFDRSLELGDDCVFIKKEQFVKNNMQEQVLKTAALKCGYRLVYSSDFSYIFKLNTSFTNFGVKTQYKGLLIGKYTPTISIDYPSFTIADSYYIDDYSFETLSSYKCIYLSGFLYHNKSISEKLVQKLSENGTRIVIDAAHMPTDINTKRQEFMNIYGQDITFTDSFPDTYYNEKYVLTKMFSSSEKEWKTCYLSGIDVITGYMNYDNKKLPLAGYKKDFPEIIFYGMNLMYHATQTTDINAFEVMDDICTINHYDIPEREIVPIEINHSRNTISIKCNEKNVNTTLAYQDSFSSQQSIENQNNLLVVDDKNTVITVKYPYLKEGIFISFIGILLAVIFLIFCFKHKNKVDFLTSVNKDVETLPPIENVPIAHPYEEPTHKEATTDYLNIKADYDEFHF